MRLLACLALLLALGATVTQAADELPIECATSLILSLQKCAAAAGGLAPQEGSPCCNAMAAAVKGPCAGHNVAKAMEGEGDPESLQVQAQIKVVTLSCGIDTAAGASATGVTTGATGLTAAPSGDFVRTYFAVGEDDNTTCRTYDGEWKDGAVWVLTDTSPETVPESDRQALLTRVCGLTAEAAGAALAEEVLKGGAAARVAAKVLAKDFCPDGRDPYDEFIESVNTDADGARVVKYGQALVDAAAEAGIPTCISYVAIKGGQAAGPSTALHPAAARPAAGSSGGGFGPVIMINGTGAGTGTGSDSSQAHIRTSIQVGKDGTVTCEELSASGEWSETGRSWKAASSPLAVDPSKVKALLTRVCGLPQSSAGQALGEELLKGGEAARVAAQAILKELCDGGDDPYSFFIEWVNPPYGYREPSRIVKYAGALVEAGDEAGIPSCISYAVVEAGKAPTTETLHPAQPATGAAASAPLPSTATAPSPTLITI